MLNQSDLSGFYGTETYHRFNLFCPNLLLTDGAKFVADNGEAYWLMDAIASHQPTAMQYPMLQEYQFWNLKVRPDKTCILTCREDSDREPVITQEIEYTDFELPEIDLWVGPIGGNKRTICLPSEN